MYNLIIIDDEAIIRNGLKKFIDWKSMGVEVVELFEDGKEAIEYLKSNDVDIILTDIKMSDMSGLDVAKFVYENKPMTKTVILSGYKEFEYAQKAIEYKVQHYLLKPTNFSKINEVFPKIIEELDSERQTETIMPLLINQYINDLSFGAINKKENVYKRGKLLGFESVLEHHCALIVCSILDFNRFLESNWSYGREQFNMALENFFTSKGGDINFHSMFNDDEQFYVFAYVKEDDTKNFVKEINRKISEIADSVRAFLGLELHVEKLDTFKNFYDLSSSNEKIFYNTTNNDSNNALNISVKVYRKIIRQYKLFFSKLNECEKEELVSLVDSLFLQLEDTNIEFSKKVIIDLFANLSDKLSTIDMDIVAMTGGNMNYNKIIGMENIEQLHEYCHHMFDLMVCYIEDHRSESSERVIEKAIRYINDNYNKDISLEDVANHVFLNSVYFCRFFKQKTNETFTDYLTRIRVRRAMELIDQGIYKTYETSERVGYKSSKYFSRVFKQHTGMSPSEYRKRQGA